jgi:flavin reductase (DIM6/NTAB) family NADH-FMN oxidoreductase RutF
MAQQPEPRLFNDLEKAIFLVTACDRGHTSGMIVTWVTAASLVPERPRIVLVLSPANATTQMMVHTGQFVIHRLSSAQVDLVPQFGLWSSATVDKFAAVPFHRDADGLPILEGVCGWARGQTQAYLDGGDRLIVLANLEAETVTPHTQPLCIQDLPRRLSPAIVTQLEEKYRRDVVRDRTLRQDERMEGAGKGPLRP